METTVIYTPVSLKGNTYRSVKNNNLITIMEVGPKMTQIKSQSDLSLKPEYIQLATSEIVTAILSNRLIFQGKEADREEQQQLNEQIKTNAPYGFKPGHKYVKLGAHSAVIKGGKQAVKLDDSQAKASRPWKRIRICTIVDDSKRVYNSLRIKSDTAEDAWVTVDSDFVGLHFTAVKTGFTMEVIEVGKTHVTCTIGHLDENEVMADVRDERDIELREFIRGIEDGRIKPEPYFYDMIEEERMRIMAFNDAMDEHMAYFDGSEDPKDFGTDESARAMDFQWIAPRQKKNRKAEPKLHSIAERAKFRIQSDKRHKDFLAWANDAFKD